MRRVVYKGLMPVLAFVMMILLSVAPAEAAYYNWDFSSPKDEEYDALVSKGYKKVTLEEAEKIGLDYYNKRNRYSEEVKIFCEGALSSELEELYTASVNCFDSYQEASMRAFISYNKGHYYSSYSFGVKYSNFRQDNMTDIQYDMAMNKAESLAAQFNHGTTKEKIENVYDWICDNMEYDDSLTRGSIYDAFVLGNTVCTGYATAFQVVMEEMGIESYLCTGNVDGENHAWNAVFVDGRYYFVDATYGDTSGNPDKWIFFGTDRRTTETKLVIHTESEYSDAEEMVYVIIGFAVIIGIPLIIIIVIIIVCLKVDSNRRKKNAVNNPYMNQGVNPYANPVQNPYANPGMNQGMSPYVNADINLGPNPYMNQGAGLNNGPYMNYGTGTYSYNNPNMNINQNSYIPPNQTQYGAANQYGMTGQYGNTGQYGAAGQYSNVQNQQYSDWQNNNPVSTDSNSSSNFDATDNLQQ